MRFGGSCHKSAVAAGDVTNLEPQSWLNDKKRPPSPELNFVLIIFFCGIWQKPQMEVRWELTQVHVSLCDSCGNRKPLKYID